MNFAKVASLAPAGFIALSVLLGCQNADSPKFDRDTVRDYASALYNRQLYHQAVSQYEFYLDSYDQDDTEAANVNYTVAEIYFERLHDYENALTYYLKVKHFYPTTPLLDETNKRIVECLERLDRSTDAQQALEESALLEPKQAQKSRPGEVIAKIGKRRITTGDLNYEISQLPPFMKSQLTEKSQKVDFLKQFIATELLYDTAKRKGLEKDKSVVAGAFQAKKNLMVQKLLEEEIATEVNVDETDLETYYKAHQQRYSEKDEEGNVVSTKSFAEARPQVMQEVIREKQQEAYDRLVKRMMRAEAVEIYESKI